MKWHQLLGQKGVSRALACIEEKGLQVIKKNWRYCECDVSLIAADSHALHFIKVQPTMNTQLELCEESLTRKKIQSLVQAGQQYLSHHPQWKHIILDILVVTLIQGEATDFKLIENIRII